MPLSIGTVASHVSHLFSLEYQANEYSTVTSSWAGQDYLFVANAKPRVQNGFLYSDHPFLNHTSYGQYWTLSSWVRPTANTDVTHLFQLMPTVEAGSLFRIERSISGEITVRWTSGQYNSSNTLTALGEDFLPVNTWSKLEVRVHTNRWIRQYTGVEQTNSSQDVIQIYVNDQLKSSSPIYGANMSKCKLRIHPYGPACGYADVVLKNSLNQRLFRTHARTEIVNKAFDINAGIITLTPLTTNTIKQVNIPLPY